MRAILIATLAAVGIGLLGSSPILAAPARGNAIGNAAAFNQAVEPVYWRHYHYRHWWWRHHHRRWW